MSKSTKTKKPVMDAKAKKAVQKAQLSEAESAQLIQQTQEWLAEVAADIAASPLDDGYKAAFLYSMAQGTFDEDMHARFLELLAEYREELQNEEAELKNDIAKLEAEDKKVSQELAIAAVGACKEVAGAVEHIVQRTTVELEKSGERHAKSQIEEIRKKLSQ
jgi:hypothetical protein